MMIKKHTSFILVAFVFFACVKNTPTQSTTNPTEIVHQDSVLFLAFKIIKNSELLSGQEIKLVSSQKVKGRVKVPLNQIVTQSESNLKATFFDFENNEINVQIIDNPLNEPIEFVNDKGEFERKKIDKNEADLFLRVNFDPKISHVIFSKGPKNMVATINLNPF